MGDLSGQAETGTFLFLSVPPRLSRTVILNVPILLCSVPMLLGNRWKPGTKPRTRKRFVCPRFPE
jgi:hypothetical protein